MRLYFWSLIIIPYREVIQKVVGGLIPFLSTYLCESGFSTILQQKKWKKMNRLDLENDVRNAISKISPRIVELGGNH